MALAGGAGEQVEQHPQGLGAHVVQRLGHGGQGRRAAPGLGDVVEAHDRQVLGHPQAQLGGHLEDVDRGQVVRGEDGGGPRAVGRVQQLVGGLVGEVGPVPAHPHQRRVDGDAGGLERLPVADLAQPRGLEVRPAGQVCDAPVAEVDEVLHGLPGATGVVGVDRGRALRPGVGVDGDHGDRHVRRHDHGGRDDDGGVDEGAGQPGQGASFPPAGGAAVGAAGVGEELVLRAVDRRGDALEELGGEGLELGDEHADDACPAAPEAARHQGGLVAELLDDGEHAGGRRGRDPVAVVHDLRHGGDGDAGDARDVGDGDPAGGRGAPGGRGIGGGAHESTVCAIPEPGARPSPAGAQAPPSTCRNRYRKRLTLDGVRCQSAR